MREPKFFINDKKDTIIEVVCESNQGVSLQGFQQLIPNTSEGASEKHLPVVEKEGTIISVKVGELFHPMTEEHSIEWVFIQTKSGSVQRAPLSSTGEPVAKFAILPEDSVAAAYAYCNLHGFWKTTC